MAHTPLTRREFSARLAAALPLIALPALARTPDLTEELPVSTQSEEITRTGEAIHQEVDFSASSQRVYSVLTDAAQFDRVVRASAAMQAGIPPGAPPTAIAHEPGGAFALFGGHITGRHVELVPGKLVVQAWRAGDWKPGHYSIVRFELVDRGPATHLVFDQTGFPAGQAEHLDAGWKANYWVPMAKVLR